jgi:hypothetical protein
VLKILSALDIGYRIEDITLNRIVRAVKAGDPLMVSARLDHQPEHEEHWMVVAGVRPKFREVLVLNVTGLPGFTRVWWPYDKLVERCDTKLLYRIRLGMDVRPPLDSTL